MPWFGSASRFPAAAVTSAGQTGALGVAGQVASAGVGGSNDVMPERSSGTGGQAVGTAGTGETGEISPLQEPQVRQAPLGALRSAMTAATGESWIRPSLQKLLNLSRVARPAGARRQQLVGAGCVLLGAQYHSYYSAGPGQNAVLFTPRGSYDVYHSYDANHNGASVLRIAELTWDAQGWPVSART